MGGWVDSVLRLQEASWWKGRGLTCDDVNTDLESHLLRQ